MTQPTSFLLGALCALVLATPALAADAPAQTPTEAASPAFKTRVGGSPADAEFRAVIQKSGDEYREQRAACRARPSAERGECMKAAKDALAKQRADAKAAHEAAVRAERAARK